MRITLLVGPADRRARSVSVHTLIDTAALCGRLRDTGVTATLVSGYDPGHLDGASRSLTTLPSPDVVLGGTTRTGERRGDGITSAGALARELAHVVTTGSIHAVGWRATAVAVTARADTGVPVVAYADQLPSWPGDDRADGSVLARLGWASLAAADLLVVESSWARSVAVRRGVPMDRVVVLPPALAAPPTATALRATDHGAPIVLSVGDPADIGSLRPVAEAVLHHPGARLVVARGTGLDDACRAEVRERLRTLPVVRRLGSRCQVEDRPAGEVCPEADLVVDVSGGPGRGLGVIAAMFAGRAVVASAVGTADELVVERTTGLLVEPRDRLTTRTAVADLLADPFRLQAYGLAGRDRAEAVFDPGPLAGRLVELHAGVVGPQPGTGRAAGIDLRVTERVGARA